MNATDAQAWMEAGFLAVEGAMATELATARRLSITEDYIRAAMLRGLLMSRHASKGLVLREFTPRWANAVCWNNAAHTQRQGRRPQHDIAVVPLAQPNALDPEIICEVKWIKAGQANALHVAKDVWKSALTLNTARPGAACRAFLLIGGEDTALSSVLDALRASGVAMRWSPAGRPATRPAKPNVRLGTFYDSTLGHDAIRSVLKWGQTPQHHRAPPAVWWHLWAKDRVVWYRTNDEGVKWRIALWELHHRDVPDTDEFDWPGCKPHFTFAC